MFGEKWIKGFSWGAMLSGAVALSAATYANVPTVKVDSGPTLTVSDGYVAPAEGAAFWSVTTHPEITSLARSLKYDPKLIYRYVHDNVETLPMFGLKKGALGALIDKAGTPFDQAALLYELLKVADANNDGIDPEYQIIKATLNSATFEDLFGVDDKKDACLLLRGGGFPFDIDGSNNCDSSGTFTNVSFLTLVVTADIDGSARALDPAIKVQTQFAGLDLGEEMSYSQTNMAGAAEFNVVNATVTAKTNTIANTEGQLETYASNLAVGLNQISDHYAKSPTDVVGGIEVERYIEPETWPTLASGLPYTASTSIGTSTASPTSYVPAAYRTKVTVEHNSGSFEAYMDELYGRRLWFRKDGTNLTFNVGTREVWSVAYSSASTVDVKLEQSYDTGGAHTEEFNPPFEVGETAGLILTAGHTSLGLLGRVLDDTYQERNQDTDTDTFPEVARDDEAVAQLAIGASFVAQQSQLRWLADGVMDSRTVLHDVVGMVAGDDGTNLTPYLDFRTRLSITKEGASEATLKAANMTLSSAMSALEGAVLDQAVDREQGATLSTSGVSVIAQALTDGGTLYDVAKESFSTVESSLTNYSATGLDILRGNTSVATDGYNGTHRLVVMKDADSTSGLFAAVAIDDDTGSVGHNIFESGYASEHLAKGAYAPQTPSKKSIEGFSDNLASSFGLNANIMPGAAGGGLSRTMLVTGSGGFPSALGVTRTYAPGQGWSHNFDISGAKSSDGMIALSSRSSAEGAKAIAAIHATFDQLQSCMDSDTCGAAEQVAVSAVTMNWLQNVMSDNVVTVSMGQGGTTYARLANGNYHTPGAAGNYATEVGAGSVSACTGVDNASVSGGNGGFRVTGMDGNVLTLRATEDGGRSFLAHSWTWPSGAALCFSYDTTNEGSLTVNNNFGRWVELANEADNGLTVTDENGNKALSAEYLANSSDTLGSNFDSLTRVFYHYEGDGNNQLAEVARYEFNDDGTLSGITTPEVDDKITFTYDDMGRVAQRTVADLGTTVYYSNDWRSEVVAPNGGASVSIGDPHGRFSESENAVGNFSRTEYDRLGRAVKSYAAGSRDDVYDANGVLDADGDYSYSTVTFTKYRQVLTTKAYSKPYLSDPDDETSTTRDDVTTSFTYYGAADGYYRQRATATNDIGQVTTYDYVTSGDGLGLLKSVTTPDVDVYADGVTTTEPLTTNFTYNSLGQLLTTETPDGTITKVTYSNHLPASVIQDEGTNGLNITTHFTYTDEGDVATVKDHRDTTTTFGYDDYRRRTSVQVPGVVDTMYVYDGDGRMTTMRQCTEGTLCASEEDDILLEVTRTYNDAGRVISTTDAAGNETSIYYADTYSGNTDILNSFIRITAPNGIITRKYFDVLGRTTKVTSHFGGGEQAITEKMRYTDEGLLDYVEDGRETKTYYKYDHWNRIVKTAYVAGGSSEVTSYDDLGRPLEVKTRAGDTVTMTYDAFGRVKTRSVTDGASYSYDYDIMGRLAKLTKGTDTVAYTYDSLGRPTTETGAHGYVMTTSYDDAEGSYSLDYNGDYAVHYGTDGLGRVDEIREDSATGTLVASYGFDAFSRVNKLTYGNGAVQEFGFDADSGWLESLTLDVNGDGDVADDDEVQFTYGRDQLGRIVREEVSNSSYIYKPLSGDDLVKYVSNPINQYEHVGGDEPAYDGNGNLTFDGTFSYDWDEENFLTKVRAGTTTAVVAEYEYDALGRRSQKAVTEGDATTRYLWGGATNYAEYSGNDVRQRVYVYGPGIDEPLMVKEADGTKHYVHRDGKNTVIAVSAGGVGNASVTNKFTMDAWGNDTDSDVSPFKFTSRRLDKETGNFYYRNRYYDPDTGRFMSNDPIGYGDGLNMYAYVGNDPVNFSDPMGLEGEDMDEITTTASRECGPGRRKVFVNGNYTCQVDWGQYEYYLSEAEAACYRDPSSPMCGNDGPVSGDVSEVHNSFNKPTNCSDIGEATFGKMIGQGAGFIGDLKNAMLQPAPKYPMGSMSLAAITWKGIEGIRSLPSATTSTFEYVTTLYGRPSSISSAYRYQSSPLIQGTKDRSKADLSYPNIVAVVHSHPAAPEGWLNVPSQVDVTQIESVASFGVMYDPTAGFATLFIPVMETQGKQALCLSIKVPGK